VDRDARRWLATIETGLPRRLHHLQSVRHRQELDTKHAGVLDADYRSVHVKQQDGCQVVLGANRLVPGDPRGVV
jgi:hypothetical protein